VKQLTEVVVEQAALDWLGGLGYETLSGLAIAPDETAAERADYKQVFLFDRLQTKLEDLNPTIPLEVLPEVVLSNCCRTSCACPPPPDSRRQPT